MAEAATVDDTLPRARRERRERIIEATKALATKGGYDAVQMRDVAEKAEVALGTLYRYFPSKVHLLITVLQESTAQMARAVERREIAGATPADRVIEILRGSTAAMQRNPGLTEAMTRALMFADNSAAADVDRVTEYTAIAIRHAIESGDGADLDYDADVIARIIGEVWWSNLLGWLSGRLSASQMTERIEVAARLILRD